MAFNVIYSLKDYSKVDLYRATQSPENISLKKVDDGTIIPVDNVITWIKDDDEDRREVMSILSGDKTYTFQSNTAQDSMTDIIDVMGGEPFSVVKISGKSKSDRSYVNLKLYIEGLN